MIKIDFNAQNEKMISITGRSEFFCAKVGNITHITCDSYLSTIHLVNGATYFTVHLLKRLEEKLVEHGFYRVHHHTLINTEHIIYVQMTPKEGSVDINGNTIKMSRRKGEQLKKLILN